VSGFPGVDEYNLAYFLKIPLYGGNLLLARELCTKSQSKILFNSLDIPTASSLIIKPLFYKNKTQIITDISKFILKNFKIKDWVFKLDNQQKG
jgi:hypothetical protein